MCGFYASINVYLSILIVRNFASIQDGHYSYICLNHLNVKNLNLGLSVLGSLHY